MFNENVNTQMIGTVLIKDKDTGEVILKKKNAIHTGNMAYIMACAMANQAVNVNSTGLPPSITWMGFGNGGSTSTTTINYRSPRVSGVYDGLPINSSTAALYSPVYYQKTENTVYFPGQVLDSGEIIPANTSKIVFTVDIDHVLAATKRVDGSAEVIPETDSDPNNPEIEAYTFDEIALVAGVPTETDPDLLDEQKSLLATHVTFHPILLSNNRNIVVEYTITLTIN